MNSLITPQQTTQGWVIEIPSEFAKALGVAEGSFALLHATDGNLAIEYLPPPSQELIDEIEETWEELKDAFEEMKRRGD